MLQQSLRAYRFSWGRSQTLLSGAQMLGQVRQRLSLADGLNLLLKCIGYICRCGGKTNQQTVISSCQCERKFAAWNYLRNKRCYLHVCVWREQASNIQPCFTSSRTTLLWFAAWQKFGYQAALGNSADETCAALLASLPGRSMLILADLRGLKMKTGSAAFSRNKVELTTAKLMSEVVLQVSKYAVRPVAE